MCTNCLNRQAEANNESNTSKSKFFKVTDSFWSNGQIIRLSFAFFFENKCNYDEIFRQVCLAVNQPATQNGVQFESSENCGIRFPLSNPRFARIWHMELMCLLPLWLLVLLERCLFFLSTACTSFRTYFVLFFGFLRLYIGVLFWIFCYRVQIVIHKLLALHNRSNNNYQRYCLAYAFFTGFCVFPPSVFIIRRRFAPWALQALFVVAEQRNVAVLQKNLVACKFNGEELPCRSSGTQ